MSKDKTNFVMKEEQAMDKANHKGANLVSEQPNLDQHKKDTKRPVMVGLIVLIVIALGGGGYFLYWLNSFNYITSDNASIESTHVAVSSKMMGRIASMTANEGDKVETGQLLVQLDEADLRAQETQAKAALNTSKMNLTLYQIALEKAQNDFNRKKNVYKSGWISIEQYDNSAKGLDSATAQYEIAKAQVMTAEAQLNIVEINLANTKLNAPLSGVIAKKNYQTGEIVQPGQLIYQINDLSNIWVTTNLEETKINQIKLGMPVEVTIDAYPQITFKGKVGQIGAAIVPPPFTIGESTKTMQKIPVKIMLENIPESVTLLPGMSAEVKIHLHGN